MPTYKDQQAKLSEKELSTYGFLGYPVLQSADVLVYKGNYVPVGEDQVPHLEFSRDLARRFNHLYGKDPDYLQKAQAAIAKLSKKNAMLYREKLKKYQETGDAEALETGQALINAQVNLPLGDQERLLGFLEGIGKIIFPEPQPLLTEIAKFPGLDGQKMSKSYHNTIELREAPESVTQKIKVMPTDPARVRRTDPGEPEKCPVWGLHKVYSTPEVKDWVQQGCRSAGIGCLECKQALSRAVNAELAPIRAEAQKYLDNPRLVKEIIREGIVAARDVAKETMEEVRRVMGLPQRGW